MFNLFINLSLLATVLACPQHDINNFGQHNGLAKRATATQDWTYEASYNWGMINKSAFPYPYIISASNSHQITRSAKREPNNPLSNSCSPKASPSIT